jgi:hypothetical protein
MPNRLGASNKSTNGRLLSHLMITFRDRSRFQPLFTENIQKSGFDKYIIPHYIIARTGDTNPGLYLGILRHWQSHSDAIANLEMPNA